MSPKGEFSLPFQANITPHCPVENKGSRMVSQVPHPVLPATTLKLTIAHYIHPAMTYSTNQGRGPQGAAENYVMSLTWVIRRSIVQGAL